jgi:hypothetical protein
MDTHRFFASREIHAVKGEILTIMYCVDDMTQYAVAIETFEGKRWMVLYKGGGRTFWTRFLLCRSVEPSIWQAIVGADDSCVEDVYLVDGDPENKVVVVELVGQERWVRVLRTSTVSPLADTVLLLKFGSRELRGMVRMLEDLRGVDEGDEEVAELGSLGSTDDEIEDP